MPAEESKQKYSYKFSFAAPGPSDKRKEEPTQADLQAYINEVLGIAKPKKEVSLETV